ncbi:MAG: lysophospholipase [Treponema sp.]
MQSTNFFQTMTDGTKISVTRWLPDDGSDVKALVQFSHGMMEHSLRYDRLGSLFAENGFVFSAHDHRGHGRTAQEAEKEGSGMFGKLADEDGFTRVTDDVREVSAKLKADFPGKKLILIGHSFGSFVAQNFIEQYGEEVSGCVLCGSAGPRPLAVGLLACITRFTLLLKGRNYRSKFIRNLTFIGYNKKIPDAQTKIDWLSRNRQNIDLYLSDAWCGGTPALSFYRDLTDGLLRIHRAKAMRRIPTTLPVLIIAGGEDPVAGYGKSVQKLTRIYRKNGMTNAALKLYPALRHELFNENDKDAAALDVIRWIDAECGKGKKNILST